MCKSLLLGFRGHLSPRFSSDNRVKEIRLHLGFYRFRCIVVVTLEKVVVDVHSTSEFSHIQVAAHWVVTRAPEGKIPSSI